MIRTKITHEIHNNDLHGDSVYVTTNENNQEWVTIEHGAARINADMIHIPITVIPDLVQALQEHYTLVTKKKTY
jgi:predicted RNA-binding protein with PIN domain